MFLSLLQVNVSGDPDRHPPGRQWLGDIYRVHQRLWMAFPDEARRAEDPFFLATWKGPAIAEPKPTRQGAGFLFRIERHGTPTILVQSVQRPEWEYAFQNAPYLLAAKPSMREFEPAPRRDQTYRFRLLANVVRRRSILDPSGKMRKKPHLPRKKRAEMLVRPGPVPDTLPPDPAERDRLLRARWDPWREWLKSMGASRGFRPLEDEPVPLFMEALRTAVRKPDNQDPTKISVKCFNAGLFDGVLVCTDPDRLRDAVIEGLGNAKAFGFGLLSLLPLQ